MLASACRRVTTISSATPQNLGAEAARLIEAWDRGHEASPRLEYARSPPLGDLEASLERLADALAREGDLGELYAERASELALEARIVTTVGTPACVAPIAARFGGRDRTTEEADALARSWAEPTARDAVHAEETELVRSDDPDDPRSLLSLVRAGIGARRLAVRVAVVQNLAPLAAVGDGVIQIAEGRRISVVDAERTAMHEIDGHLVPQARAAREELGLFAIGTRCGSDDQEGRALSLERRGGFLVGGRRHELGRRHLAARAVLDGSHFVETVRLLRGLGAGVTDGVRIALRAHRGAHAGSGGLAREIVYLPAMLRVEARLAIEPGADDLLARGRVAVAAIDALRGYASA